MTPRDIATVLEAIHSRLGGLEEGQAQISENVQRVESKVDKTNVRVTGLERKQIERDALWRTVKYTVPVALVVLAGWLADTHPFR